MGNRLEALDGSLGSAGASSHGADYTYCRSAPADANALAKIAGRSLFSRGCVGRPGVYGNLGRGSPDQERHQGGGLWPADRHVLLVDRDRKEQVRRAARAKPLAFRRQWLCRMAGLAT